MSNALDRQITEAVFTQQVRVFARMRGWLEYHTNSSRRSPEGFPDLTLVRLNPGAWSNGDPDQLLERQPGASFEDKLAHLIGDLADQPANFNGGRVVFAELKREGQYPKPAQRTWLTALAATGTVEVHVWRPSDWNTIEAVLR